MTNTRHEVIAMIRIAHKLMANASRRSESRKKEMDRAALKLLNRATRFLYLDECDQDSISLFSHNSFIQEVRDRRLSSLVRRAS